MPCAAGYVNPPGDSLSGGDTTCALDPRYCAEDHHVAYGECVPCGPNLARRAGDDVYAGNTECGCPKDHRVLNGACVACDPGVFRAPGDVPSFGDTECECRCKARMRASGFSMSD